MDLDERRTRDGIDRGAPPQGTRRLTAILPDGRTVRLAVPTPLAAAETVRNLARLAEGLAARRSISTIRLRSAIRRLSRRVADDTGRLGIAKTERARAMRRRLVARYRRLDARVTRAANELRGRVERQIRLEEETARRLGRRDAWDKLVVASSLPLFAAYGRPGSPFDTTNLALTLSLLIWLAGDEVVHAVFGSEEKSVYPWRDTDIWSYLAPVGNMLTAWWLFGDRQNERFVTGVTTIKAGIDAAATTGQLVFGHSATVGLEKRLAPDHRDDFETFKDVRVVATVSSVRPTAGVSAAVTNLRAAVRRGKLRLSFDVATAIPVAERPAPLGEVDIAWIVDTAEPPLATS